MHPCPIESQGLCAAKNGYCSLTECTVHMEKNDREVCNYHSRKAQRLSIDKIPSKSYRYYINILKCSKLDSFLISLVFSLHCTESWRPSDVVAGAPTSLRPRAFKHRSHWLFCILIFTPFAPHCGGHHVHTLVVCQLSHIYLGRSDPSPVYPFGRGAREAGPLGQHAGSLVNAAPRTRKLLDYAHLWPQPDLTTL